MPHTPLPWRVDGSKIRIRTANPSREGNVLIATLAEQFMDRAQREDNAKFVHLACTCHDDLLAACKALIERGVNEALPLARAAIAKAEPVADPR